MSFIALIERIVDLFSKSNYQTQMENYISRRYPQSAADVELFMREFEQRQVSSWLWAGLENHWEVCTKVLLHGLSSWTNTVAKLKTAPGIKLLDG